MPKDKEDDYKYTRDIPSPVSLDYPYRNLTRITGGIPSSMDQYDIKDRINSYYNDVKQKYEGSSPFDLNAKLQNDILHSYLSDISKNNASDLNKLKDIIAKDLNWSDLDKRLVKVEPDTTNIDLVKGVTEYPEYLNKPSPLLQQLEVKVANKRALENLAEIFNKKAKNPTLSIDPVSTLFHEMKHADDYLKGYREGTEERPHPKNVYGEELPLQDKDAFELAKITGTLEHHKPLEIAGEQEPAMLMYPFQKAGMKEDTLLTSKMFNKIKKLIGKE